MDIAVFIQNSNEVDVREVYKRLSNLCYEYPLDVQIQVFSESELLDPIGIVEEVIQYGIELKDFL